METITENKLPDSVCSKADIRCILMQASLFALTAICVGLLLSQAVNLAFSNRISEFINGTIYRVGDAYRYIHGLSIEQWREDVSFDDIHHTMGAVTIWLMTCLGGLSGSFNATGVNVNESIYGEISLFTGLGILFIIPFISLTTAHIITKTCTRKYCPDVPLRYTGALITAGLFSAVNIILTLLPNSLAGTLERGLNEIGNFAAIDVKVGANLLFIALFSFITAFLFSLPRISDTNESGVVFEVTSALKRYLLLMPAAGLVMGAVVAVFVLLRLIVSGFFTGELWQDIRYSGAAKTDLTGIFILIPNIIAWFISLLSGAVINLTSSGLEFINRFISIDLLYEKILGPQYGRQTALYNPIAKTDDLTVSIFGINADNAYFTLNITWAGWLLIIAGLIIALTAIYKTLRNSESFANSSAFIIAGGAVLMWFFSICATLAVSLFYNIGEGNESYYANITSASRLNILLYAAVLSGAVFIVWLARRSNTVDRVVKKLTSMPAALAITAAVTTVVCLTVKNEIILW